MYFKLTLHHKSSLQCIFSYFLPLHNPRRVIWAERLSFHTLSWQCRFGVYTQGHYSATAHRKKTVLSYYKPQHKPVCHMQDLDLQNLACLPSYNLPTFGPMSQNCSIILRQALVASHKSTRNLWTVEFKLSQNSADTPHPCILQVAKWDSQARSSSRWTSCH